MSVHSEGREAVNSGVVLMSRRPLRLELREHGIFHPSRLQTEVVQCNLSKRTVYYFPMCCNFSCQAVSWSSTCNFRGHRQVGTGGIVPSCLCCSDACVYVCQLRCVSAPCSSSCEEHKNCERAHGAGAALKDEAGGWFLVYRAGGLRVYITRPSSC